MHTKLTHVFTPDWMRGRKTDELVQTLNKLTQIYGDLVAEINVLSDGDQITKEQLRRLDIVRDDRTHLGQVIEDLDREIEGRRTVRRAA